MRTSRRTLAAAALALLAGASGAHAQSVRFKKFRTFFELLDQSGELAEEFEAANGDVCAVGGVLCEGSDVVEIDFSGRGLVGELVKDYYVYVAMPSLRRLDLGGNRLGYGVVPIPNDLAKLQGLEYLDLSDNAFVGELPTFRLGGPGLPSIKHIDLSGNQLSGRLRWNWGAASDIEFIDLSGNNLSGDLPSSWSGDSSLAGLQTLDVSGNRRDFCDGVKTLVQRGVAVGCLADGSDALGADAAPAPAPAVVAPVPAPAPAEPPLYAPPLFDASGNPLARDAQGAPLLDRHGNPIYASPSGAPLTDSEGDSVVGADGQPLLDSDGEPLVASNGTHIFPADGPALAAGGPIAYDADGQPLLDAQGRPLAVAAAAAPAAAPREAGAAAFPGGLALPNGEAAAALPVPVCGACAVAAPAAPACGGAAAVPVCLSPEQLVPARAAAARETIYPRFFPGATLDAMAAQEGALVATISRAAGGAAVRVAEWETIGGGGAQRRLLQGAGGVRGFFVIAGADVPVVKEVISALDALGEEAGGASATSFYSRTQSLTDACAGDDTNTAGLWVVGILAGVLLALVLGLVLGLFTMRRHYKAARHPSSHLGAAEAASFTTVTPSHGAAPRAGSPPGKGGAAGVAAGAGDSTQYALHSFGSTIGGAPPHDGSSGSSNGSEPGASSAASFAGRTGSGGRSGVTLAHGLGSAGGSRARPDSRPDSSADFARSLDGMGSTSAMDSDALPPLDAAVLAAQQGAVVTAAPIQGSQLVSFEAAAPAGGLPPIAEHTHSELAESRDGRGSEGVTMSEASEMRLEAAAAAATPTATATPVPSPPASVRAGVGAAAYAAAASVAARAAPRRFPSAGGGGGSGSGAAGGSGGASQRSFHSVSISSWDSDNAHGQTAGTRGGGSSTRDPHATAAFSSIGAGGAAHTTSSSGSARHEALPRSGSRGTPSPRPPASGDAGAPLTTLDSKRVPLPSRATNAPAPGGSQFENSLMASTGGLFPTHGSLSLGSRGLGGFMQGLRPDEHIGELPGSTALDSGAMLDSFATPQVGDNHEFETTSEQLGGILGESSRTTSEPRPLDPTAGGPRGGSHALDIYGGPRGMSNALELVDSMNHLPAHLSVGAHEQLDTAAMISVPQRPLGATGDFALLSAASDSERFAASPAVAAAARARSEAASSPPGSPHSGAADAGSSSATQPLLVPKSLEEMLKSQSEEPSSFTAGQ